MTVTFAVNSMADVERVDTSELETIGDATGNDILREVARGETVQRVTASRMARGEVRGWTFGGDVD